jgi:ABC-type phosphate transport system substrate-binding protein
MSMASSGSGRTRRVRVNGLRTGALVALVAAALVGGALPAGASPSMQSTGSSFASVAIQQWVGQSSTLFGLNINWQVSSSVVGLNNFAQNQIDFAASDIPYSAQQSTYYPSQPYQYLPDVAGGLAFMFNVTGNDGQRISDLNLNPSLIGQIFLGEITKWNDPAIVAANPAVAPNLPGSNIIPVFRADASGENYLLSDYLLHEDSADIVAAQNAFQSGNPGQPTASWPIPNSNAHPDPTKYKGWNAGYPVGESGSDNAANYVSALSSQGSITYVETAFAKEHGFPVASLANASGANVQPTSLDVAVALEQAQLHADLTQDLTNVYTNSQPQAYPLSAYSYIVAPCSPSLAVAQHAACAANPAGVPGSNPTGPTSPFAAQKGQALGQFAAFLACSGQEKMATLGYSPLPPVLVQEDFNAIGRMNGGQQPPPVSAATCKNPYVDGEIPLPGSPVVFGIQGGGGPAPGGGGGGGGGGGTGTGSGGTSGGGSSSGGSGSGKGSGSVTSRRSVLGGAAAAAGLTPELAAQGYTVVNGQIVKKLNPAQQYQRANTLVSATDAVADPAVGMYIGWALLILGAILLPPLIAMRRSRRKLAPAGAAPPGHAGPPGQPAGTPSGFPHGPPDGP